MNAILISLIKISFCLAAVGLATSLTSCHQVPQHTIKSFYKPKHGQNAFKEDTVEEEVAIDPVELEQIEEESNEDSYRSIYPTLPQVDAVTRSDLYERPWDFFKMGSPKDEQKKYSEKGMYSKKRYGSTWLGETYYDKRGLFDGF